MAAPTVEKSSDIVQELEKRLLADLQKLAAEISSQFPGVRATVWSSPIGTRTDFHSFDIGIDCLLSAVELEQADGLALSVQVRDLASLPSINADVCWGHPSGKIEAELFPSPMNVSPQIL